MTAKRIACFFFSLLISILFILPACADSKKDWPEGWERFEMPSGGSVSSPRMYYWVYTPFDVKPGLPLVVYLHSTHGMSRAALKPEERGLGALIVDGTVPEPECIVLVPQHPGSYDDEWEPVIRSVKRCVEKVIEDYKVDKSKIALTGYSLGAIGIWDLVNVMPGTFSRLLCVDGRIRKLSMNPELFEGCDVLAYTAYGDQTVNNNTIYRFVNTLNELGMKAESIPLVTTHGEIPSQVYSDQSVQEWLWLISALVKDEDTEDDFPVISTAPVKTWPAKETASPTSEPPAASLSPVPQTASPSSEQPSVSLSPVQKTATPLPAP